MKKILVMMLILFILLLTSLLMTAQDIKDITTRDMVSIQGGTYTQKDIYENSFSHTVSSFSIGKFEVTYYLWYTVYQWAITNGYVFENAGREGNYGTEGESPTTSKYEPVTMVNWRDCIVWCNAYSEMAGYKPVYKNPYGDILRDSLGSECDGAVPDWRASGYRLPTEGEWQYVASNMGKTPIDYASGANGNYKISSVTNKVAWYDVNSGGSTHAVGTKQANELGLFDMSGNVWEWCWDWYGDYPGSSKTDYRGVTAGSYRVLRGGGWLSDARYLQVGNLSLGSPDGESDYVGFRVARWQ